MLRRYQVVLAIMTVLLAYLILSLATLNPLTSAATVQTIYQFPPGTWVENIAVRSNGNLLVVLFSAPQVHEIDLSATPITARLVASFASKSGIQGIVETEADIFAVMPFDSSSYSLWTINATSGDTEEVIPVVPDVGVLNGLTKVSNDVLLAADTKFGAIVRLDVAEKSSSVAVKDNTMIGLPLNLGGGINGIRARRTGNSTMVYFTNFLKATLNRFSINPTDFTLASPIATIASNLGLLDDLAIGAHEGDPSYVMQYILGAIAEVHDDGTWQPLVQGLDYPTSAQFGRTEGDKDVLYVSSSGNPVGLFAKRVFDGGKIYRIDLA
jgi:hypothetical protein